MGYELMVLDESSPAVYDNVAASLSTVDNHFDDIYDNVRMINDTSSSMFDGIINLSFHRVHNGYQGIIDEQSDISKEIEEDNEKIDVLYSKINKILGTFINIKVAAKGVSSAIDYSENLMSMQNGISAMNDGSQSDTELRNKVYGASMRSRADMGITMTTVSGLSDAGFSNDEAIQYTENLNKMFAISGVSESAQAGAAQALVQSLSDGVVSGEELNSVLNAAPEIVNEMAENMGVPLENLQQMAEQGQLSADIMKNSMLGATGSINAEFNNTKANWSQTMGNIGNMATIAFEPLGNKINEVISSPSMGSFMENIGQGMSVFSRILAEVLDGISAVGGFIVDNWSLIAPIILGLVSALAIYAVGVRIINTLEMISAGIKLASCLAAFAYAAATGTEASATATATAAQYGLNTALLMCPITWIILAILLLVAAIYFVVAAINKVTHSSLSATGIIVGAFSVVWAFIKNFALAIADCFMEIWARIKVVASNIQNAFMLAVNKVKSFFYNMASVVFSLIAKIAEGLNKLPFVHIDVEGLKSKADDYKAKSEASSKAAEENKNNIVTDFKYEKKYNTFEEGWASDAYNSGYEKGASFADGFSMPDMGNGLEGLGTGGVDYSKMFEGTGVTEGNIGNINTSALNTQLNTSDISRNTQNLGNNAESIGDNTLGTYSNTDELVDISKSILSIMQQNMEKESKKENSPNIVVDMRNMNNNISSEVDADDLIKKITSSIVSSANSSTDGSGTLFGSLIG